MKRALVTGITGQDGSYLTELLLTKGYEVHGVMRQRSSLALLHDVFPGGLPASLQLHTGDMTDQASLDAIVRETQPDEIYNLAAQSFVGASWKMPESTLDVTGLGVLRILEAQRKYAPGAKLYQAGSSEQFGDAPPPQSEKTPFSPQSPYGAAKALGFHLVQNYHKSYGLFCVTGICCNHESERRGAEFVTRKITLAVARIRHGLQDKLQLGNIAAQRDWGHARDFVDAMWLMLQAETPMDYVIATGQVHSVKDFVIAAFTTAGLDWERYVEFDPALVRPAEVDALRGDYALIRRRLGWEPTVMFPELVKGMVESDLKLVEKAVAQGAR